MGKVNRQVYRNFILVGICLLCIYSAKFSYFLIPLFNKIYFGNVNSVFITITSVIIWGIELTFLLLYCNKHFNMNLLSDKHLKDVELSTIRILLIFVVTIIPIMIISKMLNWQIKIVYDLGIKVTKMELLGNCLLYIKNAVMFIFVTLIVRLSQEAFEELFPTKIAIPWGGIVLLLTFGVIEFFLNGGRFRYFYLFFNLLYGIIYLLCEKKYLSCYIVSYIIYLL